MDPAWSSRLVTLGILAAFIAGVYSAVVLGVGSLLSVETPNTLLSVVAMTVVAITFGRVRRGAHRLANRLIRGERATPYEVLSGLSELVTRSYRHEDVLPRIAELTAAGTGSVRAEVWLRVSGELLLASRWPASSDRVARLSIPADRLPEIPGADRSVAVRDGDQLLGAIAMTKRPGEAPTPNEERLLADVASQAGLILRNVRLTAELTARLEELSAIADEVRASRRRIVETQDQERRRLERDIHDGAQQHLVALAVKLRMARTMADRDPNRARTMIGEINVLTDSALENLRDLTRGIYPPTLVEKGVAAALRENARRSGALATVTTKGTHRADPASEAAAYFACLEAIQNAAKHAPGCTVRVEVQGTKEELAFTVSDDGPGFDPAVAIRGSGLRNMEDRLAVVGGRLEVTSRPGHGTRVIGRIPLGVGAKR
ncbi:MAG: histidine kinase [Actinomycetota bacterium]